MRVPAPPSALPLTASATTDLALVSAVFSSEADSNNEASCPVLCLAHTLAFISSSWASGYVAHTGLYCFNDDDSCLERQLLVEPLWSPVLLLHDQTPTKHNTLQLVR